MGKCATAGDRITEQRVVILDVEEPLIDRGLDLEDGGVITGGGICLGICEG